MNDKKAEKKQECVQVVVRCRPFNTKEKKENRRNIVTLETKLFQVSLTNPLKSDQATKRFTFDAVYDENTQQRTFYEESCYDLVEGVMEGYNGTIFAYGQTGCGKTHTMQGYNSPQELRGVIPQSFDHIFENIKGSVDTAFLVRCCYLENPFTHHGQQAAWGFGTSLFLLPTGPKYYVNQAVLVGEQNRGRIYNEEIRDLLCDHGEKKDKLELKEDPSKGVYVKDLNQVVVSDHDGINRLMEQGQKMRTVGATAMNATSSRSHSIFTIVVEMNDVDDAGKDHIRVGKLNLVDLAGSERASKTGASGERLREGCKINLSLSALGIVISALVDGKGKHIPYRDSKLTRLLQDSLGGNTKTLMVAAISPADYNYEETLSTLRYANRAKNIQNKPKINEDPKDAMLRQYKEEIEMLKRQLAQASLVTCNLTGTQVENPSAAGGFALMDPAKTLSEKASPLVSDVDVDVDGIARVRDVRPENPEGECMGTLDSSDAPDAADASKMAANSSESAPEASEDPSGLSCHGGVTVAENDVTVLPGTEGPDIDGKGVDRDMGEAQDSLCVLCTSNDGRDDGLEGQQVEAAEEGRGSPEVVVKEKVVERVVVEEKVVVQEVEVESQKMAERRQALENYSKAMEEQRNRLGQVMRSSSFSTFL